MIISYLQKQFATRVKMMAKKFSKMKFQSFKFFFQKIQKNMDFLKPFPIIENIDPPRQLRRKVHLRSARGGEITMVFPPP